MTGLLEHLKEKVPDPHALVYVLALVLDLDANHINLTAAQRAEMRAERERIALEELWRN